MAYLRGNSVVDGNLYVEGDLLVKEIRPDREGAIIAYKDEAQGMAAGRHLISGDTDTGSLVDSILIEEIGTSGNVRNSSTFYFAEDNDTTHRAEFFKLTKNSLTLGNSYLVSGITVEDVALVPTYADGKAVQPENITSWRY